MKARITSSVLLLLVSVAASAQVNIGKNGDIEVNGPVGNVKMQGDNIDVTGLGNKVKVQGDNVDVRSNGAPSHSKRRAPKPANNHATVDTGAMFVIEGASQTARHDCEGRSVKIDGANNKVRLIGYCPTIVVDGARNRIDVDQTSKVQIDGAANQVMWHEKFDGKQPTVASTGAANKVYRGAH
jgi:hypothetical protein